MTGRRARALIGALGGDPFFPLADNGGSDVRHYRLAIGYDPAATRLDGVAVVSARATQALSRFDRGLIGPYPFDAVRRSPTRSCTSGTATP